MSSRTRLSLAHRLLTVAVIATIGVCAGTSVSWGDVPVGRSEVKLYAERDFVGESRSYVLNARTHRIVMVNRLPGPLDNGVSSIHVGSDVFAILFDHHDFHIDLRQGGGGNWFTGLVKAVVDLHKKMTPFGHRGDRKRSANAPPPPGTDLWGHINVGVYTHSSSLVRHDDTYTSMLIVPKDFDHAYGVALYNRTDGFIRVEPIADAKKYVERRVPDFGPYLNDKVSQLAFLGPRIRNTHITLYDGTEYQGRSITLPGEGSDRLVFDLADYGFAGRTKSVRLSVKPVEGESVRVAAPSADETSVYEVVSVIPIDTAEIVPAREEPGADRPRDDRRRELGPPGPRPLPPGVVNMRGRWTDGRGRSFEIIQHGTTFILRGRDAPLEGAGVQPGPDWVSMVFRPAGEEVIHAEGRVETGEHAGVARRIVFDNGFVLDRD
jgi:hypothetical protein